MSKDSASARRQVNLVSALLIILFYLTILGSAAALPSLGAMNTLVDFDAFYIVGQLVLEGRAAEAYDPAVMEAIQGALVDHGGYMLWNYPPQFDLLTALLPGLPRNIAYAVFTCLTFTAYLYGLMRLAGPRFAAALVVLTPPIFVALAIGQSSFLVGALMIAFAWLTLNGARGAGWPLGFLVIKPHLGLGLGIYALASGRWRVAALSLAIVAVSSLLATWLLGPQVWAAFLGGMETAKGALETEFFPLFRMTSVYALLHTNGVAPAIAFWAQSAIGVLALGAIVWAARSDLSVRHCLALTFFASALVSPYFYDYDMTIAGIGVALVIGELLERASRFEALLMLLLAWITGAWGMVNALSRAGLEWADRSAAGHESVSFGAVTYLLLLVIIWRVLRRPMPAMARA